MLAVKQHLHPAKGNGGSNHISTTIFCQPVPYRNTGVMNLCNNTLVVSKLGLYSSSKVSQNKYKINEHFLHELISLYMM